MAFDWAQLGTNLANLTSSLTAAGVTQAAMPNILQQIGLASNPNQSAEIAICGQLLQFSNNPAIEQQLVMKLITEQGLPASAAALA